MSTTARVAALLAVLFAAAPSAGAGDPPCPPGLPAATPVVRGIVVHKNVEYGKVGDRALLLDFYVPAKPSRDPLPLIVWVHGGGWSGGNKEPCPAAILVNQGYAVASVGYRLSGEAKWPAQIQDCKAAIRWLRSRSKDLRIHPGRFGAWGSSAGGHLVALLGTSGGAKDLEGEGGSAGQSSVVQAVCDYCGPTDFLQFDGHGSTLVMGKADSLISQLFGGPLLENKDKAAQANPITYVTKDDPPFLVCHGDKDNIVPLNQSELLEAALAKARVPCELFVVKGGGHGFGNPQLAKVVTEFFEKHLKKAPPAKIDVPPATTPPR